jgi:hypothetical protein
MARYRDRSAVHGGRFLKPEICLCEIHYFAVARIRSTVGPGSNAPGGSGIRREQLRIDGDADAPAGLIASVLVAAPGLDHRFSTDLVASSVVMVFPSMSQLRGLNLPS